MLNPEDVPERFPITAGDDANRDTDLKLGCSLMVPEHFDSGIIWGEWRPARWSCPAGWEAVSSIASAIDDLARALEALGSEPSVDNIQFLASRIAKGEYMNRRYINSGEEAGR